NRKKLKRATTVPPTETQQLIVYTLSHGQYLEQFSHLGGREQLLRRRRRGQVTFRIGRILRGKQVGDAAVDQELRLAGVAEDFQPGTLRRERQGAEINM